MKILSASQVKEADRHTIISAPISSLDLMERAANACVHSILHRYAHAPEFTVLCGKGNNGGDGLAIARLLADTDRTVHVFVLEYKEGGSDDFTINLDRLKAQGRTNIKHVYTEDDIYLTKETIIIDTILGTGINKQTDGLIASVISRINKSGNTVIAIDVPSGMSIDEPSAKKSSIIHASLTLTFQQPKLAFMFPESAEYVGEFEVLDIGLDTSFLKESECRYFYLQDSDIAPMLRPRAKFSHKGTYGHSLIIAGSYGRMGAAVLASHACLRSGTGLLTAHIPACGYQIMQSTLPEAMVSADSVDDHLSHMPNDGNYTSIGIGPGIGTNAATVKLLKKIIQSVQVPMVIDADALNILGENKTWIGFLPALTILTPHPKEFDRLTKVHTTSWERLESARTLAQKHRLIIVLKGAYTAIALPDGSIHFNSTGNPALAKGGSGDVLTGIITSLLSRGYSAHISSMIGVYIHGLAADIAVKEINAEAMIASDVVSHLSAAFDHLYGYPKRGK